MSGIFVYHNEIKILAGLLIMNIYICKCFSLYDVNNEIDVQFCMNTFDHVISFFYAYEYKFFASTYLGQRTTFTQFSANAITNK